MSATGQAPPRYQIHNRTPWVVAPVVHATHPQGHVLSICVKASYAIDWQNDGAPLQPLASPLHFRGEVYADPDDPSSELLHPNECELWKPAADVLLLGSAQQPGGVMASTAVCGFSLGPVRKQLRILGNRVWQQHLATAEAGEPQPFATMPLRWSRAFGGPGFADNPAGLGFAGSQLPNIEDEQERLTRPGGRPRPVGVGPINRQWRPRAERSGSFDRAWLAQHPALPEDFDWGHFNCAPADQQVAGYLRGDEAGSLSGLHADCPHRRFRLPGTRLRCLVEDVNEGEPRMRELPLVCDTAIIDAEQGQISLLWRGITPVSNELMAELQHLYIASEAVDQPRSLEELMQDMALAKEEEPPQLVEAQARLQAGAAKVAATLARFGITTSASALLAGEALSTEELAQWPLDPHGPKDAQLQEAQDELETKSAEGEERARSALARHGLDYDALKAQAQSSQMPDPEATIAQALDQVEEAFAAQGEQAPEGLAHIRSALEGEDFQRGLAWMREQVGPMAGPPPPRPDLSASPESQGIVHADPYALLQQAADEAAQMPEGAAFAQELPEIQALAAERAGRGVPQPDPASLPPEVPPVPAPPLASAAGRVPPQIAVNPAPATASAEEPLPDPLREAMDVAAAARYLAAGAPLAGQVFAGSDFSGLCLSGRDLREAHLGRCQLRGSSLDGACLAECLVDGADASEADLRGADLSASSWDGANLRGADLQGADVSRANFHGADLSGADLRGCCMEMTNFTGAKLVAARFDGSQGEMPVFSEVEAAKSSWQGCVLDTALFQDAMLAGSDFSAARLPNTHFIGSDLQACSFRAAALPKTQFIIGCDASAADFTQAQAAEANFMWSRLRGSCFLGAELSQANFMACQAEGVDMRAAVMRQAILRDAQMAEAQLDYADCFRANLGRCDFRAASLVGFNAYQSDVTDMRYDEARSLDADFGGTPLAGELGNA